MKLKHWLILKLGGYLNTSSCPVCGFEGKEGDINDRSLSQGKHLNVKLRQVGDDKIGIVSSSYPLSDEQFYHIRKTLSDSLAGYKLTLLENLDMEVGILAKDKLLKINTFLNKINDKCEG